MGDQQTGCGQVRSAGDGKERSDFRSEKWCKWFEQKGVFDPAEQQGWTQMYYKLWKMQSLVALVRAISVEKNREIEQNEGQVVRRGVFCLFCFFKMEDVKT